MLDYRSWLGLGDDEDEDPVKKALGMLGQGATTAGQAVSDVGAGIGAAVSPYLPQPSATPAPEDYSTQAITSPYGPEPSPAAPETGWSVQGALAPAAQAYGSAFEQVNREEDEAARRNREVISNPILQTAIAPVEAARRAARLGTAAIEATPEAIRETANTAAGQVGLGREDVGVDLPLVGRTGITDVALALNPSERLQAVMGAGQYLPAYGRAGGSDVIERAGRAALEAGRGVLGTAGEALAGNAERVAAADARMAAEGSTLAPGTLGAVPGGSNLEARIAAAEARLEHAATRLESADAMLAQAADAGSPAELRAARSSYSPARSAYDEAAARVEQLREQRRMVTRDIEGAGYGRPVEDAGIDTSAVQREATSAYPGQPEPVPPFRDDAPRSISLNAGFGVVPDAPRRAPTAEPPPTPEPLPPRPSAEISPLGKRVMDTYTAVTPARVERSTTRATRITADQIASRIPARGGGLSTSPEELVRQTHAAIVRNLGSAKTVMTGIRPGAIAAYLRGEGLTSKVETRDLARINQITQGQVNVAGGRAGKPYTIAEAADFAQRESEQMRVATGGSRFPDPETGAVDEAAPRVMYGYVSEGQPLVGPNRPTAWLVWEDQTPRITSAHHPYGLTSPGQDIHASMPPGLKAAIWSDDAVAGGRVAPAVMEGGRLAEAAPGAPGASPMVFDWQRAGLDVGGGRRIADTNWLVGPEGEDAMRANGLLLGMPGVMQRAIARGDLTDPEDIAAALMRGGSPKWKSGWAAVMNPSRSESLIVDPSIEHVKAIYLTGSPKDLARRVPNSGGMTELQVAQRLRDDILAQHGKDVPILFTDISKASAPTAIADAQLLAGPPTRLAEGRAGIVDRYTGVTNPATGEPYVDIGVSAGTIPPGATPDRLAGVNRVLGQGIASSVSGGVGAQVNQEMNPDDPYAGLKGFAAGALVPPLAARAGMAAARRAGRSTELGSAARIGLGDVPPSQIRTPELPGFEREAVAPLRQAAEAVVGPAAETAAPASVGGRLPGMAPSTVERIRGALAPWLDRAGIVRYAGMLSDTAGHAQNAVGNLITVGAAPVETGIAAGLDVARAGAARAVGGPVGRALGGPERTVWFGEVPAMLGGMRQGAKAGLDDAVSIMTTGVSPDEAGKLDSGRARFATNIPGIAPAGSRRAAVADFAVEGPLRSLAAADAIFRGSSHAGHLAAETLAEATRRAGGATPTPEQLKLALHDPGVVTRAEDQARRAVLQEERGITTAYRNFIESAPAEARLALQTVVPFVRTPYNVMAQGLGMTDVGALVGVVSDLARGKGPRAVQKRLGRAALGTAVMGWATSDYAEGNLTGPYPSDAGEASTLPPGWRPWSRKVEAPNGETWYVPLAALGPFAVPAVYAILRAEAIKKGADAFSPEWAGDVAMGLGRYAEQSTFLEGLGQVSKLFDERSGDANLGKLLNQTVASYSPHVVGGGALGREIQRIVGMPSREPQGPLEALAATHPLTAGTVEPRQDVLGREQSMGIGGPLGALVRGGVENDAPVIAAFRDAQQPLPRSAPKSLTDPATKQSVSLSAEQRRAWDEAFGPAIEQRWAQAGSPSDAKRLDAVSSKAREDARRAVLGR